MLESIETSNDKNELLKFLKKFTPNNLIDNYTFDKIKIKKNAKSFESFVIPFIDKNNNTSFFYKIYFYTYPQDFFFFECKIREILTKIYTEIYGVDQSIILINDNNCLLQVKRTENLEIRSKESFSTILESYSKINKLLMNYLDEFYDFQRQIKQTKTFNKVNKIILTRNSVNKSIDYGFKNNQYFLLDDTDFTLIFLDKNDNILSFPKITNEKIIIDGEYYSIRANNINYDVNKKEISDLKIVNEDTIYFNVIKQNNKIYKKKKLLTTFCYMNEMIQNNIYILNDNSKKKKINYKVYNYLSSNDDFDSYTVLDKDNNE